MRSTTLRTTASAALLLTSALLLTACNSGGGATASGTTTAGASSSGGTSAAGTSGGATAGSGTSGGAATSSGSTTGGSTSSGSTTGGTAVSSGGCRNLVAGDAVKAAVTRAYEAESHRGHITPRPHQFLYGQCNGTTYAATAFDLTAGATFNDQVASQDDGSTRKYFSLASGGSWTMIGSADFPDNGGCIAKVPASLATLWGGCRPGDQ